MEQNQFKCSGDCLRCHPSQRQYCAAQFTYNTMRMVEDIRITVEDMRKKIEAIQNSEASIFDPTAEIHTNNDKAQEGDGA